MKVKILGTGCYLPPKILQSSTMEKQLGLPEGYIMKRNGVRTRRVADPEQGETTSQMSAWAAEKALQNAGLTGSELDLIIFASAGPEQAIPDTAPLIQEKLGLGQSGITCFSVHSTCLSCLTALDIASSFIETKRYQNVLIVSCEISSMSINPKDEKTFTLFGDAAAAVIVGPTPAGEASCIHNIHFSTFGEAALLTEVPGCGTRLHPNSSKLTPEDNTFRMKGRELLKYSLEKGPQILEKIWPGLSTGSTDIDIVIPHQPSRVGMIAFSRYFPQERTIQTLEQYGNCVSVSIPLTLHEAITSKRLNRGSRALLFGTGAGLTIAGMVLTY